MSRDTLREQLSPEVLALFDAARARVRAIDPDVVEVAWPRQGTAGFGVGPKKMSEQYIYYGAELPDPHDLLSGKGKRMRSVRVTRAADLEREGLTALIRAATTHLPRLS